VEASWTAADLDRWVYDEYLGPLADVEGLTESALVRYVDWLINRLKEAGHKPRRRPHYKSVWKDIARARAESLHRRLQAGAHDPGAARAPQPHREARRRAGPPSAGGQPDGPDTEGIFDGLNGVFLTNFTLDVEEETEAHDGHDGLHTMFSCRLVVHHRESRFKIDAREFADDGKLRAAVQQAGGSRAVLYGKPAALREAVSTLSWTGDKRPGRRVLTTDFGWAPDGAAYRFPGGAVTADGFAADGDGGGPRVDLSGEELARHLGLLPPPTACELLQLKRHVVEDLLQLNDRRAAFALLGAAAAALLMRFAPDADPFGLWLVGPTGAGKSFLARLFMNLFGNFPVASGRFAAWNSTANFLQRQGYYFKDALYLVDDYKPEVMHPQQAVRVLQNYADRTGRGRLRADATTNATRPVRGLLVSTGEDLPEHTASVLARCVVVPVPQRPKDVERGERCGAECGRYRGLTADLLRRVLADRRHEGFADRVRGHRRRYHRDVAGQPNDSRVAGNFGLLSAGFEEATRYLADAWPARREPARRAVREGSPRAGRRRLGRGGGRRGRSCGPARASGRRT
jgi:hypothetical protein